MRVQATCSGCGAEVAMDPDATLREMRELVGTFNEDPECFDPHWLVDLVEALDKWLVDGGFLPSAWGSR